MMLSPRWKKIVRDLWGHKLKTLLVVISVAVGIFAVGFVMGGRSVLTREFDVDFVASNAPSATFSASDFDDSLVKRVAERSDVLAAQGRRTLDLHYSTAAKPSSSTVGWDSLTLSALPDFDDIKIDKLVQEGTTAWPPGPGEIVLEKSALQVVPFEIGQRITVETDAGERTELRIVGFVHDINAMPTQFFDKVIGYTSMQTLSLLNEPEKYNELQITCNPSLSQSAVSRIAVDVRDTELAAGGVRAFSTIVPEPGSHFLGDIFKAVALLLLALGVLALALSGFLVVTTVSALVTQQIRQIGIMKAVGGQSRQIRAMYFTTVAAYGVLALAIGIPAALVVGRYFVSYGASILNFRITDYRFPVWVVLLEVAVGLLVPLLSAVGPVRAGARTSVVKALNATGISPNFGHGIFDRLLGLVRGLPRPVALSLRNTFLRKGRLILTLTTLVLASAVVMAVLSVRASTLQTVDQVASFWVNDVRLTFGTPQRVAELEREAKKVSGVTEVETWLETGVSLERQDGSEHEGVYGMGIPAQSTFVNPKVISGRWLEPGDEHAIVVNSDLVNAEPNLAVGDTVRLTMQGEESDWRIVGIVEGQLYGSIIFFDRSALAESLGAEGLGTQLVARGDIHTEQSQQQLAAALETGLDDAGLPVSGSETQIAQRETVAGQLGILVTFLVIMAALLATVGVIGLTGTMTINVLESTREIGVMRSIGAAHRSIFGIYITEAVVVGVMAWALGALLSWPLSVGLVRVLADAMGLNLVYQFSWSGVGIWLVAVIAIAALASLIPAWNASRVSVRDAIAYE
ncbi:MAG: FtsX-like permease family protein [Coriobacteriia bacterium]